MIKTHEAELRLKAEEYQETSGHKTVCLVPNRGTAGMTCHEYIPLCECDIKSIFEAGAQAGWRLRGVADVNATVETLMTSETDRKAVKASIRSLDPRPVEKEGGE